MVSFTPTAEGVVRAHNDGASFLFASDSDRDHYRWVAALKYEDAQKVINKFAAHIARVGLDESEWLRRSALGGE